MCSRSGGGASVGWFGGRGEGAGKSRGNYWEPHTTSVPERASSGPRGAATGELILPTTQILRLLKSPDCSNLATARE